MITQKKMKIIGQQDYINKDTGEIETMNIVSIEERDTNFHKVWLPYLTEILAVIGNKKIKFLGFLLDNMDYENKICLTMRQMAEQSETSLDTVSRSITALKEINFIQAINTGVYQVNPDMVFKGGKNRRQNVLYRFAGLKNIDREKENNRLNSADDNGEEIAPFTSSISQEG